MSSDRVGMRVTVPSFGAWGSSSRKKLLSSAASYRCFLATAIMALLPSTQAFAQCLPLAPAAVSISSGSCSDPALTTRESAGPAPVVEVSGTGTYSGTSVDLTASGSGYGMYATDTGVITVTGTSLVDATVSTYGAGGHGLFADGEGLISGSYVSVSTDGAGAYGIGAVGTDGSVTLIDSKVTTERDGAHGAYAASGGTITLIRTDITAWGAGASAAFADAGGNITLTNLNTFSFGDNAPAAVASGAGSNLALNAAYVNIYGNDSAGLLAIDGGTIIVSGGAVATGDYYGGTVIASSPGMLARGNGSSIQVSNGASSATYGADSPGVWADDGGRIDFTGYGIFTYQPNSPGAKASGAGSTVTLTGIVNRTTGPSSAGILVESAGTVIVTGSEVTTGYRVTGSNPPVLQFPEAEIGLEAHGADVVGADSKLQAENTRISTNGDGAIGVKVNQGGAASITGGTITTHGADTAAVGGADGVRATDAGSSITLSGTSVTTTNINAIGLHAMAGGEITATGVTVTTTGNAAHGLAAIDGGTLTASGTAVAVSGDGSAAVHLAGSAPSTVSFTGGSLSATNGAIILAEGGTGTISISRGTAITPAVVNGRLLLAQVTEDAVGTRSNLTLNIAQVPSLTGDIVVESSALSYDLGNSDWTGNLLLTGPGNTASASLSASQWTGDLLADAGNSADVALAQGSLWHGLARNAGNVMIDASSGWNVTGDSNATDTVTNAGLIQFVPRSGAYSTLTVGNYTGSTGSGVGFNTYLGADNSPTNLLVINGGQASGTTSVFVHNTGGPGEQTMADGIRLVQVTGGGTTTTDAFTLGQRVAAGAYEYQLFRGGSTDPNDWFLRSHLNDTSADPTTPSAPDIPLYRPEVPLYTPVPAMARQMGLAILGTLHERVGEEMNVQHRTGSGAFGNGTWARLIGETGNSRWSGTVDASAQGVNLAGIQAGFDVYRGLHDDGHRDHIGLYIAEISYRSSIGGFALGQQNLQVGRLALNGPAAGAYWTHFGASGWYTDAVIQGNWFDATATSLYQSGMSTGGTGITASLEGGYPIRLSPRWQIEPQAQIIYQKVSMNGSRDVYSTVAWNEGDAVTGRLGGRLQYTAHDGETLWQPYLKANLWHGFSGTDQINFGASPTIESRFGTTSLEVGAGITARITKVISLYGHIDHRWSVAGGERRAATQGAVGVRLNW